jgi:hypothetical protein
MVYRLDHQKDTGWAVDSRLDIQKDCGVIRMHVYQCGGAGMPKLDKATLTLPEELKREARAKASMEGKNLSLVVRELLRQYVKDDSPPPKNDE